MRSLTNTMLPDISREFLTRMMEGKKYRACGLMLQTDSSRMDSPDNTQLEVRFRWLLGSICGLAK